MTPTLTQAQIDEALALLAADATPDQIEAAMNMAAHKVHAALLQTPVLRRAYAAALSVAADRLSSAGNAAAQTSLTAPHGVRFFHIKDSQALRTRARDLRRLATQVLRRQPDDESRAPKSAAEVKAMAPARPRRMQVV
jgi:hypothetical protein